MGVEGGRAAPRAHAFRSNYGCQAVTACWASGDITLLCPLRPLLGMDIRYKVLWIGKISKHKGIRGRSVPLVSCHRMLEPGSSCHFFSSIFLFGQSDFQVLILGIFYFWSSCYFFGAPATFWSSCWVLACGGGSSVRRPLRYWRNKGIARKRESKGIVDLLAAIVPVSLLALHAHGLQGTQIFCLRPQQAG